MPLTSTRHAHVRGPARGATNATRRSPLCCANTSQSRSNVARSCRRRRQPDGHRLGEPLAHHARSARSPTPGSAPTRRRARTCPCTSTVWPFSARWPRCLNVSGNTTTSMLPAGIVEHEDAHAVALARLQRPQAGDDAADRDVLAAAAVAAVAVGRVAIAGATRSVGSPDGPRQAHGLTASARDRPSAASLAIQIGRRLRAVLAEVVGVAIDRMAASSRGPAPPSRKLSCSISVHGGTSGSGDDASGPTPRPSPPPKRSTWPRSLSRWCALPCSHAPSIDANSRARTRSRGRRAGRPALGPANHTRPTSPAPRTRACSPAAGRGSSHSACSDGMRPPSCVRASRIELIAPSPSPLIAVSPKRTPLPLLHREIAAGSR